MVSAKKSAGAPCTHQFLDTLTAPTTNINPDTTPPTTSAPSTTTDHPVVVVPSDGQHEVEIARIEIASTTGDVTSVYASLAGAGIHYRVVDEYGGGTLSGPSEMDSTLPLTLGELESFFTDAWPFTEVLEMNFPGDVEGMLGFFRAHSQFYPQLDALLRQRVREAYPEAAS